MSDEKFRLPTHASYVNDLTMTGEKAMLLTAVGLIAGDRGFTEQEAWDYVRTYAARAAKEMGFDVKVW